MSADLGLVLYLLAAVLPIFLLIAYLTILMMDYHSKENDDE
jgi:chromate transport protein ChrA